MRHKLLKIICSVFLSFHLSAAPSLTSAPDEVFDQKALNLLQLIDQELEEVDRLQDIDRSQKPELKYRKAELLLEQGRIYYEWRNRSFLKLNSSFRGKVDKKTFFSKAHRLYVKAKNEMEQVLRQYPKYQRNGEINFILGFYEKDFGSVKKAIYYFQQTNRDHRVSGQLRSKTYSALAELHYGLKQYQEAIDYYLKIIQQTESRWWTKDAYQLAWCYYWLRNYAKAIVLLKQVVEKSRTENYVNLEDSALRDIGMIYASWGKAHLALDYYQKEVAEPAQQILELAQRMKSTASYDETLSLLNQGQNYAERSQKFSELARILLEKMLLSDVYNQRRNHLQASQQLVSHWQHLTPQEQQLAVTQMVKQASQLQQYLAQKKGEQLKEFAQLAHQFFDCLIQIDSAKAAQYQFYQAESAFATDQYTQAAGLYQQAFDVAKKNNQLKLMKLAAEGLLACLGEDDSRVKDRSNYLRKAYLNYLEVDSKSLKAQEIYRRLYRVLYDGQDTESMRQLLAEYSAAFQGGEQDRDRMLRSLIQLYQKQKNNQQIARLMDDLNQGKIQVSNSLKGEVYDLKQQGELRSIELLAKDGNYEKAYQAYEKSYQELLNSENTKKKRKSSKPSPVDSSQQGRLAVTSFNLMILAQKLLKVQQTYNWAIISLDYLSARDFAGKMQSYNAVSKYLFERLQSHAAADLAHRTLSMGCQTSQEQTKRTLFNNAVLNYVATENTTKLRELLALGEKCGLPDQLRLPAQREYYFLQVRTGRIQELSSVLVQKPVTINHYYILEALGSAGAAEKDLINRSVALVKTLLSRFQELSSIEQKIVKLPIVASVLAKQFDVRQTAWESIILRLPEADFNRLLEIKVSGLLKLMKELEAHQGYQNITWKLFGLERAAYLHARLAKQLSELKIPVHLSNEEKNRILENSTRLSDSLKNKAKEYLRAHGKFERELAFGDLPKMNRLETLMNYPIPAPWQ